MIAAERTLGSPTTERTHARTLASTHAPQPAFALLAPPLPRASGRRVVVLVCVVCSVVVLGVCPFIRSTAHSSLARDERSLSCGTTPLQPSPPTREVVVVVVVVVWSSEQTSPRCAVCCGGVALSLGARLCRASRTDPSPTWCRCAPSANANKDRAAGGIPDWGCSPPVTSQALGGRHEARARRTRRRRNESQRARKQDSSPCTGRRRRLLLKVLLCCALLLPPFSAGLRGGAWAWAWAWLLVLVRVRVRVRAAPRWVSCSLSTKLLHAMKRSS